MMSLRQRVEELLWPSLRQEVEWFINGLNPNSHATMDTKTIGTQQQFDQLIEEAKMIERRT